MAEETETEKWIQVTTQNFVFLIHPSRWWPLGHNKLEYVDPPKKHLPVVLSEKKIIICDEVIENDIDWNNNRTAARQILEAGRHNGLVGIPFLLELELFDHHFNGECNEE